MCATETVERDPRLALAALADEWQVPCDPSQIDALLGYADLLLHWTARINLTGARSVQALVEQHFPDAFALARWLEAPARLVDVGSGGGLPALPLALLRPMLDVQLCEPIAKKGAFLRTAIRQAGLAGRVRLDTRRAEKVVDAGETFDVAISRATFAPDVWLALGRRLIRPGGRVFALTTPQTAPAGCPGPAQVGPTQVGQLGPTELGPMQLGPTHVEPAQVRRTQVYAGGRRVVIEVVV